MLMSTPWLSLGKSWSPCVRKCLLLVLLLGISLRHQVEAQRNPIDTSDCIGEECCRTTDSEIWRGMSCSFLKYLDDDPLLQMEGCAKHGEGCQTICANDELGAQYAYCDATYDKDAVYDDWWQCFQGNMVAALLTSAANAEVETVPPENVTNRFCNLLSQPGCPLCIKMRWGSPCASPLIKSMCRIQCRSCYCPIPDPVMFQATSLDCRKSGSTVDENMVSHDISAYADTCSVTCPADTSSSSLLRCELGGWTGATSDPTCMRNCDNTSITLPLGGTLLTRTGLRTNDCSSLNHNEKCKLSCGPGTTASAYWQCYNGQIISTNPPEQPQCLNNCGVPPVPRRATGFGTCSNVVLDDPDANFESAWSSSPAYASLQGKSFSVDLTSGVDTSTSSAAPLRDQLTAAGVFNDFSQTCSVLKEENSYDETSAKFEWRRLEGFSGQVPARHLQVDPNSTIYVPPMTPHGSSCTVSCESPFEPDSNYTCWNGTWTMPTCTVQLNNQGILWPVSDGSVVSYLGSLYVNYNLEVIMPARENLRVGEFVTVCARDEIGCPTGQCFARVPLEDGGRITTKGQQLRIRLGYDIEREQIYGCSYEVTIPEGTVVAIIDRNVANRGIKWVYRLDPPPPRLMAMELEPSFNSVYVRIKYNGQGTIKCLTKPLNEHPVQRDFDDRSIFWTQHYENEFATGTIGGLHEKTDYSIYCQATSTSSLTQALVDVIDQERTFETKSKIPYCYSQSVKSLGHTEIVLEVLYSTDCMVRCAASQREDGLFDDEGHRSDFVARVNGVSPVVFFKDPVSIELKGLIPNMPTQILCIATSQEEVSEFQTIYHTQLSQDYWNFAVQVTTPAMTNTNLASLTAAGCRLVPPFAPDRSVYACAVQPGASIINMHAELPAGMYSTMECKGYWVSACSEEITVSDEAAWQFNVRAQSGALALYVIVMITDPPVEPVEIKPQLLPAVVSGTNVTVCAVAKSNRLPQLTMDKTEAQLLPGPWDLPIQKITTGSNLPTCRCSGCNVEMIVTARGAGANLTFVIFIDGYPTFSLQDSCLVSFMGPEVADVVPPEASVYTDTELVVYGSNFGGTNTTGAVINVMKMGEAKGLPAATWFAGCPTLDIQVSKTAPDGANVEWVHWEFSGRYTLTGREQYAMTGDRKIKLNFFDFQAIRELYASTPEDFKCDEKGCARAPDEARRHIPKDVRQKIQYEVGMCCFKGEFELVGFEGDYVIIRFETGHRAMPTMAVSGAVWRIASNFQPELRLHSENRNLRQETGWEVKYREKPPAAGEEEEKLVRRLEDTELPDLLEDLQSLLAHPGLSYHTLPRALSHYEIPEGKNWWKNDQGYYACDAGVDDDSQVQGLLQTMGVGDDVPTEEQNCGMFANRCSVARFMCACTCEDYDPTPIFQAVDKVTVTCERCGDGIMIGWEKCDDGNLRDGDGCSRECIVEPEYTCTTPPNGKSKCKTDKPDFEDDSAAANLCGPTTWVDDSTLRCTLTGTSLDPLGMSVEVRGQSSVRSTSWIQYVRPTIRSMLAGVVEVAAGSNAEWTRTVEWSGGQRFILNGRSLPPTPEEAAKHQLTMLIGSKRHNTTTILCSDVEVKSSTSFECPRSKQIDLSKIELDAEVTIRVGEISSAGRTLSTLDLQLRQPVVQLLAPVGYNAIGGTMASGRRMQSTIPVVQINDTDVKRMLLNGSHLGSPDFGEVVITVNGHRCNTTFHAETFVECDLKYVPNGTWPVMMSLGNIPAISLGVNVTVLETMCHRGEYRLYKEDSDCAPCVPGTADPNVNSLPACPDCVDGMYQNDSGELYCKDCVPNSFSVPNRSTVGHCRCHRGYYHPYSDDSRARRCNRCEQNRSFGWDAFNMTFLETQIPNANAEEFYSYGGCPAECYGLECAECPFGAFCFGNAAWPRVMPGFWAHDVFQDDARKIDRCMPMEACLGDNGNGTSVCADGYDGPRCGSCVTPGYYKDQHKCIQCPDNQWVFGLIFALFFLCVLIFGIIPAMFLFMKRVLGIHSDIPWIWRCWFNCCCCFKCLFKKKAEVEEAPPSGCYNMIFVRNRFAKRFWRWDAELGKAPLLRTLSMCLNFGHTCYAFAMLQKPAVAWPDPSWELLSWTKLLTMDVEFMKPDCVVPMPFFQKWVLKFFMPFGMFIILLIITLYLKMSLLKASHEGRGASGVWAVFRFSCALIIHVILIWHLKITLSPIDCNWCREGVKCLDEYTLIECWGDDPEWIRMMVISIVDFVFVSGFFPIFLLITIFRAWRATRFIDPNVPREGRQISFISFFVTGYRDRFSGGSLFTYGWEVVVLFRKLTLVIAAKFTTTEVILGANIQLLVLLLSLVMQLTMRPYKDDILCNIDNFLCIMLFISLLSACQLTMGGLGDMKDAYVFLNVAALFGGAATGILVCVRKLMYAYLNEQDARKKALGQEPERISVTPVGDKNDVKVLDFEDTPTPDVKEGKPTTGDEKDSETGI